MAIRNILKGEDPILHKKAREVTDFNDRLHQLLDDMKETMEDANGVGLAGPQVGVLRRVAVVNVGEKHYELVNPVITEASEELIGSDEGCLSYPGERAYVERPSEVTVTAQDRFGEEHTYTGEGLLARAFCHEIGHLDGIVFLDIAIEPPEDYYDDEEDELEEA